MTSVWTGGEPKKISTKIYFASNKNILVIVVSETFHIVDGYLFLENSSIKPDQTFFINSFRTLIFLQFLTISGCEVINEKLPRAKKSTPPPSGLQEPQKHQ